MLDYNFKRKKSKTDFGWHSRGYLPHFDGGEQPQFITFRLFDSMPQSLLEKWRKEADTDAEFRKRIEGYLDEGYGNCWLRLSEIASIIQDALLYKDGADYRLISWVIMPNHVHILIAPMPEQHLPDIMHSIKSYSAQLANKKLRRRGQFWQHESFDRYIRNQKHFSNVIEYIEMNPVKAGLCRSPEEWKFSSAFHQVS